MAPGKLTVMYSCTMCGLQDAPVYMEYRPSEMPILEWMKVVQAAVGSDHLSRSPRCVSRTMRELKIPVTGADWIGGPPIE